MKTVFFNVLAERTFEKAERLKDCARFPERFGAVMESSEISGVPGSVFAYWASNKIRSLYLAFPPVECGTRHVRAGGQTSNDLRYVRTYWEVSNGQIDRRWATYLKGGAPSKFYYDQKLVVAWDKRRETFPGYIGHPGRETERPASVDLYFRPGITWPLRASRFAPQCIPEGSVFSVRGYAVISDKDDLLETIAIFSSSVFDYLLKTMLGRYEYPEFVVGVIQKTPLPQISSGDTKLLAGLARRAWSLKRKLDAINETSHAFILPALLLTRVAKLDPAKIEAEVAEIEAEIDEHAYRLYGLSDEDRLAIAQRTSGSKISPRQIDEGEKAADVDGNSLESDVEEEEVASDVIEALNSWSLGVAFGRFDIRLATGERTTPKDPEPFDPLPARSPGMVPEDDQPFHPNGGILVDDPGDPDDITSIVEKVFATAGIQNMGNGEVGAVRSDDPPEGQFVPAVYRQWLQRNAFPNHIRMYSKSRRKAPIYWQLATASGGYAVWLYIRAFTKDTLFRVQNDYVAPKLAHEQRQLEAIRAEVGPNPSAAQSKAIGAKETFVEELQAFLDEVKRAAPLWNPDLDDGVIINFAPLWRIVQQHKPWQRELKAVWDALCAGTYDWSHLAMHLWPERVVPKCAEDRSLAIAHGLEDVFWFEDADGKWKPHKKPQKSISNLISERTSTAVKAALKSLLDAPETAAGTKRSRKSKTA